MTEFALDIQVDQVYQMVRLHTVCDTTHYGFTLLLFPLPRAWFSQLLLLIYCVVFSGTGPIFFDDTIVELAPRPTVALPTTAPLQPDAGPEPEPEEESELRDFFPETWIWEILRTK